MNDEGLPIFLLILLVVVFASMLAIIFTNCGPKFCPECGARYDGNTIYCDQCGVELLERGK